MSSRATLHRVLQDIRLCVDATTNDSPSAFFLKRSPNTVFSNPSNRLYPVSEPTRIIKKGKWRTLREATPLNLALARKTVRKGRLTPAPSPDSSSFASSEDLPLPPRQPLVDINRPSLTQLQARRRRMSTTLANTLTGSPPAGPALASPSSPQHTIWYKRNPDGKAGTSTYRPLSGRIV